MHKYTVNTRKIMETNLHTLEHMHTHVHTSIDTFFIKSLDFASLIQHEITQKLVKQSHKERPVPT